MLDLFETLYFMLLHFYAVSQMQIEGLILFNHLYLLEINLKPRITSNKVKAACRLA